MKTMLGCVSGWWSAVEKEAEGRGEVPPRMQAALIAARKWMKI